MPLVTRQTLVCLIVGLMAFPALSQTKSIRWSDIGNSVEIIGRLGVPLGTVVTIEATVVDVSAVPEPTRHFLISTSRFLRIETVGGVNLEAPPLMRYKIESYLESDPPPPDPDAARKRFEQ